MQVRGKVFVVTGAGNGIGRETTLALLDRGARVAAVDLKEELLAETKLLAGPASAARLSVHAANVADADRTAQLPDEVVAAHGRVDGLLNIAGIIQPFVPFADLDPAVARRVMDVNFWGVANMCRAFLPLLTARPEASLVNVSSMGGFLPVPGQTMYGASKAAVKLLTEGLHAEAKGTGLRVTVVFPGAIGTRITENSGVSSPGGSPSADSKEAKSRTTSPQDAALVLVKAIETGAYRMTIGKDAAMLDKLSRAVPERAMEMIATKMAHLITPQPKA